MREMKDSGIPWIGEIPKEWSVLPIKRIKDETHPYPIGDGDHGSIKPEDYIDDGIPYVRVQNLSWGGDIITDGIAFISEEVHQRNLKSELHPNDILIAKTGATIGKTGLIPLSISRANTTSSVAKVTVSQKHNYKYFFYVFGSEICIRQMWLKAGQKSAQPGFNVDELVGFLVPIPPLSEQKLIADYLDRKCGEIDELVVLQEKMIEELKSYKQSVITEAVTKGLNPNAPMKDSGIEWIGEIPEGWEITKVKYCLDNSANNLRVGPFGSALSGNDFKQEGYWVYNQRTVLDNNFYTNDTFVDDKKYKELYSFRVFPNDILITTRGSIGKIAIVPEYAYEGIIHPCIIRFVIDANKYNHRLLVHIFNDSDFVLNQIRLQSNSTTIDVLYSYTLKNIMLPLIPRSEQQAIADYLDEKCAEIDSLIALKQQKIEHLKEYKKSLIYEYVTGKKQVASADSNALPSA